MTDVLTALDATFLELEEQNESALMSIGGVMIFDPPPGGSPPTVEEICAGLGPRLGQLPRYSQRLSSPRTGRFSWPHWVPDEKFDISNHVTRVALPQPGSLHELWEWSGDFYSHRLDRTRPLWEMALIEGLEDGRWAIAHKTHHCLVDGVGSVDVAYLLLDTEPSPAESPPAAPTAADEELLTRLVPDRAQPLAQATQAGAQVARAAAHAALHPREAVTRSASLVDVIVRNEVIGAPHSSINQPMGSTRRFATVTVSLADLKAIRERLGGSVNDVVLAACTTGLRKLLLGRGEELPSQGLRAMVPMNLRQASEHLALGNRVSTLFVALPVAEPQVAERYGQVVAATTKLKHSGAAVGATTMMDLTALAPPVLHATLARSLYATRLFNVTITNVPGPQIPLYSFGSQLKEIHPVVPLAAEHGVGVAVFSYNGVVTFGVIADSESTPDIHELASGIEEGIDELRTLAARGLATVSPTA